MNSLIVTMRGTDGPVVLPVSYQHMLQGLLYSAWRERAPELHDSASPGKEGGMHFFTFSPLEGRYEIRDRVISFDQALRFEVRSIRGELIEYALGHFAASDSVRLGRNLLRVENLETRDRMMFPREARIRTRGMVTVHKNTEDGTVHYFSPDEDGWELRLRAVLRQKLRLLGMTPEDRLEIRPAGNTPRKCVTIFKGTYITGYTGDFDLRTDPDCMALLYYSGLGSRNSQGCGMFDIIQKSEFGIRKQGTAE